MQPAAWIDERVAPVPKNIYGVTKTAAEDLCQLFHRNEGLAAIVLRTSRFFPEEDDDPAAREAYADDNAKANEYLFRRVAIEDVVEAHLLAVERAPAIGFGKYIISATTPFKPRGLRAPARRRSGGRRALRAPGWEDEYARRGWRMFPSIDRVYDNALARRDLGWRPKWDFAAIVERLRETGDIRGPLAKQIGAKGYHAERFEGAPYPVTEGWVERIRGMDTARPARPRRRIVAAERWRLAASGRRRIRSRGGSAAVAYQVEVDARWETKRGIDKRLPWRRDDPARD